MNDGSMVQNQGQLDAASSHTTNSTERMMSQSEVNALATKVRAEARAEAYEQARREVQQERQRGDSSQHQGSSLTKEEVLSAVDEKLMAIQNHYSANQLLTKHQQAIQAGRQEYGEDFEREVGTIDFSRSPQWLRILDSVPNAHDVMMELGKDDNRFANIHSLVASGQESKATRMVKSLSESIAERKKSAQKAKEVPQVPSPLSNIRPSTASSGVGGMPTSYSEVSAAMDALFLKKRGL